MLDSRYATCIQACSACAIACETCASRCLEEADLTAMRRCIQHDRDCADLCRLAETLMLRNSPLVSQACRLCALACLACADECRAHHHEHCQQCAQACQHCADECQALAA